MYDANSIFAGEETRIRVRLRLPDGTNQRVVLRGKLTSATDEGILAMAGGQDIAIVRGERFTTEFGHEADRVAPMSGIKLFEHINNINKELAILDGKVPSPEESAPTDNKRSRRAARNTQPQTAPVVDATAQPS